MQLFEGYPFSKDYNEERGPYWSVTDVSRTGRNPTAGTCWTCKSAVVPGLMEELGGPAEFYRTPFQDLSAHFSADCHDSETIDLVITRPAFKAAIRILGEAIDYARQAELKAREAAFPRSARKN